MTTTQTPVEALMALVAKYGDACYERGRSTDFNQDGHIYIIKELEEAVEASARALAAIPAVVEIAYTPGEWFDATTVDLMEAFYRSRLPAIREAAQEHGYAIGVHGSMRRDLDLIAAPWRDGASDADTLADAIQNAACGIHMAKHQWEQKPAGRVATCLPICWTHRHGVASDGHIDLSVIAALRASSPADRIEADEALMRTNLEALEHALDAAQQVALETRAMYGGYMNHRQKAADADVARIESAIAALRKRLESSK